MGCMQLSKKNFSDFNRVEHLGVHELKQNYKIDPNTKIIGAGTYGKVFLSRSLKDPDTQVAIKVLNKERLGKKLEGLKLEANILQALDHPNIVKYYETYDDVKYMYFVMEHCPGGALFELIAN